MLGGTGKTLIIVPNRIRSNNDTLILHLPNTCDGGTMIDLSLMKKVQVDPEQLTAKAQTGVTWGDFDKATQVILLL